MAEQYIELTDDTAMHRLEEWVGREYARSLGKPYPIPPDEWNPPPRKPPLSAYTYYYRTAMERSEGGGVLLVDDAMRGFCAQPQNLSDGTLGYSFDIAGNLRTYEQLTENGQLAVNPILPASAKQATSDA